MAKFLGIFFVLGHSVILIGSFTEEVIYLLHIFLVFVNQLSLKMDVRYALYDKEKAALVCSTQIASVCKFPVPLGRSTFVLLVSPTVNTVSFELWGARKTKLGFSNVGYKFKEFSQRSIIYELK